MSCLAVDLAVVGAGVSPDRGQSPAEKIVTVDIDF